VRKRRFQRGARRGCKDCSPRIWNSVALNDEQRKSRTGRLPPEGAALQTLRRAAARGSWLLSLECFPEGGRGGAPTFSHRVAETRPAGRLRGREMKWPAEIATENRADHRGENLSSRRGNLGKSLLVAANIGHNVIGVVPPPPLRWAVAAARTRRLGLNLADIHS